MFRADLMTALRRCALAAEDGELDRATVIIHLASYLCSVDFGLQFRHSLPQISRASEDIYNITHRAEFIQRRNLEDIREFELR